MPTQQLGNQYNQISMRSFGAVIVFALWSLGAFTSPAQMTNGGAVWLADGWPDSGTFTNGQIIPATPGWQVVTINSSNGKAIISGSEIALNQSDRNSTPYTALILATNIPAASGSFSNWTFIASVKFFYYDAFTNNTSLQIGWTTNAAAYSPSIGLDLNGGSQHGVNVLFNRIAPTSLQQLTKGTLSAGTEYNVAIQITAKGWRAAVQGGFWEQLNCTLNSTNWFVIYSSTNTYTINSGRLYPIIDMAHGFSAVITHLTVCSNFVFNGTAILDDETENNRLAHVPYLFLDHSTNLWASWYITAPPENLFGNPRTNYLAVRKKDGSWSAPMCYADSFNPNNKTVFEAGPFSYISNQLSVVYTKTTNMWRNAFPAYKSVSYDGTNIALSGERLFNMLNSAPSNFALIDTPAVITPKGTIIIPTTQLAISNSVVSQTLGFSMLRSTNNGVTWLFRNLTPTPNFGFPEPAVTVEADGSLGCWLRSQTWHPYYSRSTDDGVSWSTPVSVDSMRVASSRIIASPLPDGTTLLTGTPAVLSSYGSGILARSNIVCWIVSATNILRTFSVVQGNDFRQYPFGLYDNGFIDFAWSEEHLGANSPGAMYFARVPFTDLVNGIINTNSTMIITNSPADPPVARRIHMQWNWSQSPGASSLNQTFVIRYSTTLALPIAQWTVLTNVAATNLSIHATVEPGQHYFVVTSPYLPTGSGSLTNDPSLPTLLGDIQPDP